MKRPVFDALGPDDLRALAADLVSGRLSLPADAADLHRHVGAQALGNSVADLNALTARGLGAAQAAVVLELLAVERERLRTVQDRVELVWTGPEAPGAGTRDTWTVVHDLFSTARKSVLVSCFAIHQGATIFAKLAERMAREPELRVRLFVNVHADRDSGLEPRALLDRFASQFRASTWPGKPLPEVFYDPRSLDPRPDARAVLHAKCVVIDESCAFVSSANFTEAAQERNIEAGVVIRDPAFARAVCNQFESLISRGFVKRVPYL